MDEINYNLATNHNYIFVVAGEKDIKPFNFYIQKVTLPSLSMDKIKTGYKNNPAYMASETLIYDDLSLSCLLNETFDNYLYIFHWLESIKNSKPPQSHYRDCKLIFLNNNKKPILHANFYGVFPTNLSSIELDTAITETEPVNIDITFGFQYYTFDIL